MKKLSLLIALGALKILRASDLASELNEYGVNQGDINLTKSDQPWSGSDRGRVVKTLDACLYASMEKIGLPKFSASSEYQAAVIYEIVNPVNVQVACHWSSESRSAEDITGEAGIDPSPVSPGVLHVLVCSLYGHEDSLAASFDKKNNKALEQKAKKQQA